MDKPVLAAIDGLAAGPGLSLCWASDLVLAERGAKFNCKFTSYARTPDGGRSVLLAGAESRRTTKANELLMLSETFGADEAERWNYR